MRTDRPRPEHSLRSNVGIGSESDCLLGQLVVQHVVNFVAMLMLITPNIYLLNKQQQQQQQLQRHEWKKIRMIINSVKK